MQDTPAREPSPRPNRTPLLIAALLIGVLGFGLIGFGLMSGGEDVNSMEPSPTQASTRSGGIGVATVITGPGTGVVGTVRVASATPSPTSLPSATVSATATPAVPIFRARRVLVVRAGPGPDFATVGEIGEDDALEILGVDESGRWYQVQLPDGATGWVLFSAAFANISGPDSEVPIIEGPTLTPTDTDTPPPTGTVPPMTTPSSALTAEATEPVSEQFVAECGGRYASRLAAADDIHVYDLRLEAGQRVEFDVNRGEDLRAGLGLFDDAQEILQSGTLRGSGSSLLLDDAPYSGPYQFVLLAQSAGTYTLTIRCDGGEGLTAGDAPTSTPQASATDVALVATGDAFAATSTAQAATQTATARVSATPTPTLIATMANVAVDASPTPPRVAELPLVVRSESGAEIGNGRMIVYFPDRVEFPNTARVELELAFNNYYITPTPRGERTVVPVDSPTPGDPTSRPPSNRPTPTPRIPQFEGDAGSVEFFERMGASLICLPSSFSGCDDGADPSRARRISLNGMNWSWIIRPTEDLQGLQDLRLELWRLVSVNDGPASAEVLWEHAFQIALGPPEDDGLAVPLGLLAGAALALIGLAAFVAYRRGAARLRARNAPNVFISYRRGVSAGYANMLHDRLEKAGADAFIDVDDIHAGSFSETIRERIETADYVLVVLAPGTLESTWVRQEIAYAHSLDKTLIPVLINKFDLYSGEVPDDLRYLQTQQAVEMLPQYVDAALEKLLTYMGLKR